MASTVGVGSTGKISCGGTRGLWFGLRLHGQKGDLVTIMLPQKKKKMLMPQLVLFSFS